MTAFNPLEFHIRPLLLYLIDLLPSLWSAILHDSLMRYQWLSKSYQSLNRIPRRRGFAFWWRGQDVKSLNKLIQKSSTYIENLIYPLSLKWIQPLYPNICFHSMFLLPFYNKIIRLTIYIYKNKEYMEFIEKS